MNFILGPIFIFYDKDICSIEDVMNDFFQRYTKDDIRKMREENRIFIHSEFEPLNKRIIFPKTGAEIFFMAINAECSVGLRGYRALTAFVPEHWKDSHTVKNDIEPNMYTSFLGYYDQHNIRKAKAND